MNTLKKEISLLICGALIGALISTCFFAWLLRTSKNTSASQNRQIVLKLGHGLDTSHPVHQGMLKMKGRLEEFSDGAVTIDIYPSSVLGSELQCIEQLQNGSLAMTKTSAAAIENFVPELSVFGYPYLFRDSEYYWAVLQEQFHS